MQKDTIVNVDELMKINIFFKIFHPILYVKLSFFGGINEIGGNKILLQDEDTKIFLDFGLSFGERGKYYEEFLNPRVAAGIKDFLSMGLLPDIEGIYRDDLLEHMGRKAEGPEIDGVILSHAHADHANYISFLHKDIPVYCGKTCKRILDAVNEQSQRNIENEVTNFKERPLFRSDYRKPPIERMFNTFVTGDTFKIGSLEVEPIHVDHSVPGAYGFIIWTSCGPVVYTGDMRTHGLRSDMTMDFVKKAKEVKPIAMITEGTRIDTKRTGESEKKVYTDSKKEVLDCKNLSIVDFNFKDVDRFKTFYAIAKETGRKMVISFKHCCFLEKYSEDEKLDVPHSNDENIMIFKPKRNTGTYCDEDYSDKYIKKRLEYPNLITAEEIAKRPSEYMVVLNYWYFNTLVDLNPVGAQYVHSLSEPFNEEMEISYDRMMNWIRHFKMNFFQAHCSGHINGEDIKEVIKDINPKTLFPVHTEHPEMFKKLNIKTKLAEYGREYEIN